MRFMMIVKADAESESGVLPDAALLAEMGKFNESLVNAGVLLGGEGLQASDKGARVRFSGAEREVIPGPFDNVSQLVGGFWLIQVAGLTEALTWAKRVPFRSGEVELRPVFELEDVSGGSEEWQTNQRAFRERPTA